LKEEADTKADVERREAEAGTAQLEAYRAEARSAWLSSGGSAAEFVDAWPRLKQAHLTEAAKERITRQERVLEQSKADLRESGRYSM